MMAARLSTAISLGRRQRARLIALGPQQSTTRAHSSSSAAASSGPAAAFPDLIFSGVQPTGRLHLGNYLGAVRQWVALQRSEGSVGAEGAVGAGAAGSAVSAGAGAGGAQAAPAAPRLLFSVVDLHAMTLPYEASALPPAVRELALTLLACGLDASPASRVALFRQSAVREHAELAWVLGCATPLGWLQRMTQYKQKAARASAAASGLGLLSYPVLQAADVLLYRATRVPVGEDQRQHLELVRDVANSFNLLAANRGRSGVAAPARLAGDGTPAASTAAAAKSVATPPSTVPPVFPLPETLLLDSGAARVMSLRDGRSKMSKSDASDDSRINLGDDPDVIARKIRGARTDSSVGFSVDAEARPEKTNLLGIYAALSGEPIEAIASRFANSQASAFKGALAELVVAHVAPIGAEMARLRADPGYVDAVLASGADRARTIAERTMYDVREAAGYE
jgi:tryptophanyl-tRNA synthetase